MARVSRCAPPAKTGIKYLFRRYCRRGRGRGTLDKTDNIETTKKSHTQKHGYKQQRQSGYQPRRQCRSSQGDSQVLVTSLCESAIGNCGAVSVTWRDAFWDNEGFWQAFSGPDITFEKNKDNRFPEGVPKLPAESTREKFRRFYFRLETRLWVEEYFLFEKRNRRLPPTSVSSFVCHHFLLDDVKGVTSTRSYSSCYRTC